MAVKMINENGNVTVKTAKQVKTERTVRKMQKYTHRPQNAEVHHGSTHRNDGLGNVLCNSFCNWWRYNR